MKSGDKVRVAVSTVPFGDADPAVLRELDEAGVSVLVNPTGRRMTPLEVAEFASAADCLIAGTEDLRPLIRSSTRLRHIARVGVGLDGVPLAECRRRQIAVTWTPEAVTPAVAELALALMIASTRQVARVDRALRRGEWRRAFGVRIGCSYVGLLGFGRIGTAVARLLVPFQPKEVLVFDRKNKHDDVSKLIGCGLRIRQVGFDEIVKKSDVLSVHLPASPLTIGLVSEAVLRQMKPGSHVVNTARGGIVAEAALTEALESGHLGGAAVDVFVDEPYQGPLARLENAIVTPHLGSCGIDCRILMERQAVEQVVRFVRGEALSQLVPVDEEEYQGEESL